jgi:beta-catenin-like protein 1
VKHEGLELLVQNMSRFDESQETEGQAVHNTLGIFENLVELNPAIGGLLSQKTKVLEWLLERVKKPAYDDNNLYGIYVDALFNNSIKVCKRNIGYSGSAIQRKSSSLR